MKRAEQDALLPLSPHDLLRKVLGQEEFTLGLRPKTLAVLRHLARRAGRVVSRQELLDAVWGDTKVNEAALKVCVREIRTALGDDASAPRFIETVPREGYRFIGRVVSSQHSVTSSQQTVTKSLAPQDSALRTQPSIVVGREAELALLHEWLEQARSGQRQVVFMTGEAGIGKTTLVDTFLTQIAVDKRFVIARGQCLEQYGAGEAYMPVLEAIESLCRGPGGQQRIAFLRRSAPTWLIQMPALVDPLDREALQREIVGATRERMLREAAGAVEVLASQKGFVLVLEDLHWSDHATVELISFLARHRGDARLLLIGTYRPEEVLSCGHPLQVAKHELQSHGQCQELALTLWHLGYPGQALRWSEAALALARELAQPFSLAYALSLATLLSLHSRNGKTAQERIEMLIALSREQGFTLWLTIGTLAQGCALIQQGYADKAIPQIRQGVAALQSSGMILYVSLFLALLAEAYGEIGQQGKGLAVVEEALAALPVTGEHFYEAELYRLKGELLLAQAEQLRD